MIYVYGTHAKLRMVERDISLEAVESLLSGFSEVIVAPSKTDPEIDLVMGFYEGKGYVVIVNRVSQKIVTLRRARDVDRRRR